MLNKISKCINYLFDTVTYNNIICVKSIQMNKKHITNIELMQNKLIMTLLITPSVPFFFKIHFFLHFQDIN